MRNIAAALKLTTYLFLSLLTIPLQAVILCFARGPGVYAYPMFYHRLCCRLFGITIIREGNILPGNVVFAGNHLSYLDIPVLSTLIPGSFVAKKEVGDWPFFGTLARLQKTVFISRRGRDAGTAARTLEDRLSLAPIIIFPEGTSSNGINILPFKSALFGPMLNKKTAIQPFTISILSVNGNPASDSAVRDIYAWHGEMTLVPHIWNFAKQKGCVLKVKFQEPISSDCFNDRKHISHHCHELVSSGLDLNIRTA